MLPPTNKKPPKRWLKWQGWIRTLGAFIAIYGYTYCLHVNYPVSACRNSPYRLHYSFFIYKVSFPNVLKFIMLQNKIRKKEIPNYLESNPQDSLKFLKLILNVSFFTFLFNIYKIIHQ